MGKYKTKPKYSIGQKVWVRPWLIRGNGMYVYQMKVTEVNSMAGSPYYSLEGQGGFNLYVVYEREMSKRPERLVREALKELEYECSPKVNFYNNRKKYLNEILKNATHTA